MLENYEYKAGGIVYAGGICGFNSSNIINCMNSAKIDIKSTQQAIVGGITGDNGGTVSKCLNTADLSSYVKRGINPFGNITISYCSGIANSGNTENNYNTAKNITATVYQVASDEYIKTSAYFIGGSCSGKNYARKDAYVLEGRTYYAYEDIIKTDENGVILTDIDTINNIWNSY